MSLERIKERHADFGKALDRLNAVLAEDPAKTNAIIDATIQRFEFTFELAWKLAQAILRHKGLDATSPRAVIKEAFKEGMIQDGPAWIDMLESRNKTARIYDEAEALKIYKNIKAIYSGLLARFRDTASLAIVGMEGDGSGRIHCS